MYSKFLYRMQVYIVRVSGVLGGNSVLFDEGGPYRVRAFLCLRVNVLQFLQLHRRVPCSSPFAG